MKAKKQNKTKQKKPACLLYTTFFFLKKAITEVYQLKETLIPPHDQGEHGA